MFRVRWCEQLESRFMLAVSPVLLNSWFVAGQGEFAQAIIGQQGGSTIGPTTTWTGQTTPVLGDVQKISCSTTTDTVYVNTPDLASYVMGAWWGNAAHTQPFINLPKDQNAIYKITLNTTYPQATHGVLGGGAVALAVNGVVIYNAGDAFSYSHASGTDVGMTGDGLFNRMAEAVESVTFDAGNGHQPGNGQYHYHTNPVALRAQLADNVDYIGTTDYFPYDPAIYLLHQGEGADGDFREHTADLHHSPIIGWMFDGYPIYGPYGYSSPLDPASAVTRMQSSYALRSITTRTTLPGWAAQLAGNKLGAAAANTAADGVYTMTTQQQSQYAGPAVSASYPLGRYGEDYAYVPGSGDLDQFCGRWCKTPDFPNGTYAYFLPIDAAGNPVFPFIVNRQMYGQANGSGKVTSITESVTVAFNSATNAAPAVTGPAGVSLPLAGTLAFTGANAIAMTDVDAADEESIALSVTAGTLAVDLTGVLTSHVAVTAGANGSSSMTLKGGVALLNAALATLTYTAPASGTAVTLTVQANDGGAANNLSNTLVTAITLTASPSIGTTGALAPLSTLLGTASASATVAVTGRNLAAAIVATAPAGFEVSSDGVTFGPTTQFAPASGMVTGTLSVRLAATATVGTYSGDVSLASSGAATVTVATAPSSVTDELIVNVAANQTVTDATPHSGAIKLVKRGAGTLVLNAANSHTGTTTVEAGTLVVAHGDALSSSATLVGTGATLSIDAAGTMRSPSLTVGAGGLVILPTVRRQVVALAALAVDLAGAGRLDIGRGRIEIAAGGTTEAALRAALVAGRNAAGGGGFNGSSGIMTTGGKASPGSANAAVGYRLLTSGAAVVSWAAYGDANLDGMVNLTDVNLVNAGGRFGQGVSSGVTWAQGDYNYSGGVTLTDISLLNGASLFGQGSYLPVAPAGAVQIAADAAASTPSISQDIWIAYALDVETQQTKKR